MYEIILVAVTVPVLAASVAWFRMASKMSLAVETSPIWARALPEGEFDNLGWLLRHVTVMRIVAYKLYREGSDPYVLGLGERMRRLLFIYMGCLALWVAVVIPTRWS